MSDRIRWGILGTGKIAHQLAAALRRLPEADLLAAGSRSAESAARFANEFGISRCYGSYAELVSDPEVEVVYVATPHSCHAENSRLALDAGKSVFCEKPFTINPAQAREVIRFARERKLFLMFDGVVSGSRHDSVRGPTDLPVDEVDSFKRRGA